MRLLLHFLFFRNLMRVFSVSPLRHNDQVTAVLLSDGVGGFVSFGRNSHDFGYVVFSAFILFWSCSFYTLFVASCTYLSRFLVSGRRVVMTACWSIKWLF